MASRPPHQPLPKTPALRPGDVVDGKYRVEHVLGEGGMGIVVAAVHLRLGQRVALKFVKPGALQSRDAGARFLREARAAVRLTTEHVARVSDVDELPNGALYMVMEYLEGVDLRVLLRQRGRLLAVEAVEYLIHACDAIAEAHSLGIIHRDIKPSNMFLSQRRDGSPCVKVLDFGISKAGDFGLTAGPSTHAAARMGTPYYMSPEQMKSARDVDPRTDIWSLGVVLHELVCGRVPFRSDVMTDLYTAVTASQPAPLSTHCADLPAGIEDVVLRCLEKDPNHRFPSAAALASALAPYAPPRALPIVTRICVSTAPQERAPLRLELAALGPHSFADAALETATSEPVDFSSSDNASRFGSAPVIASPSAVVPIREGDGATALRVGDGTETDWNATPAATNQRTRSVLMIGLAGVLAVAVLGIVAMARSAGLFGSAAPTGPAAASAAPVVSASAGAPPVDSAPAPAATSKRDAGAPSTVRKAPKLGAATGAD